MLGTITSVMAKFAKYELLLFHWVLNISDLVYSGATPTLLKNIFTKKELMFHKEV